jgi:hypothetical protein
MDKIYAVLAVKTNLDLSCEVFSEKLASSPGVLKRYPLQINTRLLQGTGK